MHSMIAWRVSIRAWLPAILCLAASSAIACKLPVFRYALERWPVDRYRMVAMIDGQSSDQVDAALDQLQKIGSSHANVDVQTIDLSKLSDEQFWQLEGWESEQELPVLQVFFPERDGQRLLCWSGPLTPSSVRSWRDSELRRQIVGDITSGASAVWILVEGTDTKQNQQMAAELKSALARASQEISIPAGVIDRQDAANYLRENLDASMDDVLRSDIPLKIDFVSRRLAVSNTKEPAMRAMILAGSGGRNLTPDQAFVVPVFGRGRMIEPLTTDRFSEESVIAACRYLVGECNCTVKSLNPGVDLILDTDWRQHIDESLLIIDRSVSVIPQTIEIPVGKQASPAGVPISKNLIVAMIVSVGLIAVMSLVRWRRTKPN